MALQITHGMVLDGAVIINRHGGGGKVPNILGQPKMGVSHFLVCRNSEEITNQSQFQGGRIPHFLEWLSKKGTYDNENGRYLTFVKCYYDPPLP